MEGGHNNIYLGMPFLHKNSVVMAFDNSNENSLSLIIGVPLSEVVVPSVLQIPVSQSSQGYCYPCEGSDAGGYSAAHDAVTAHDSMVPARLLNCQPFKIQVTKES